MSHEGCYHMHKVLCQLIFPSYWWSSALLCIYRPHSLRVSLPFVGCPWAVSWSLRGVSAPLSWGIFFQERIFSCALVSLLCSVVPAPSSCCLSRGAVDFPDWFQFWCVRTIVCLQLVFIDTWQFMASSHHHAAPCS